MVLQSLLTLYAEIVVINSKQAGFDQLLESLVSIVVGATKGGNTKDASNAAASKQSFSSVAQTIASITASASTDKKTATVERFIKDVASGKDDSVCFEVFAFLYFFSVILFTVSLLHLGQIVGFVVFGRDRKKS